jgi:DNA-binding winged helix-turn-helix (wHTH) protein/tetratricopeptide (TPR) repeat protein
MEPSADRELLRFGPFELDPAGEELRRSGVLVRLPPQPFLILLLLVQRAGAVVSRDELHAAIWGNETFVDYEHGINSAIRNIRFALGDHAETPRYIRTLPRRGYSFIATVERVARSGDSDGEIEAVAPPPPPPSPPSSGMRIAPRMVAIAAATMVVITIVVALIAQSRHGDRRGGTSRSVAVLPFRRLGPPIAGVDERTFAEELRATIDKLPRARVSFVEDPRRANVVINGTIRQSEDGIRVIVSVADAASRTQLWSETVQRPATREEGIAVEVAHQVTREMARRFLPPPRREPPLETNASAPAIALYRRARLLHSRSQAYDWMRTKELYEAALRAEPRFAEAWSGLSDVWAGQALNGPVGAECDRAAARAVDAAHRALALQPRNAEAQSTLGLLAAQRDYDLAAAEDAMRRAVASDPEYVDARFNLAVVLAMRGQPDESLREFAAAEQLDPVGLDLSPMEPFLYLNARRYEDARARYREILAVNPQSGVASWGLLHTSIAQKNWSDALALAAALRQEPVAGVPRTEAGFLKVYCGFESFLQEGRRQGRFSDYFLALYYSQISKRDRAFELLDQAVHDHVPVVSYIMVDPRLDNLRGDQRFRALLARIRLGRPPTHSNG